MGRIGRREVQGEEAAWSKSRGRPAMSRREPTILFSETQRFTQVWIWAITLSAAVLTWAIFLRELYFAPEPSTSATEAAIFLLVLLVVGVGIPAFVYSLRLEVELNEEELAIRFRPFVRRRIPLSRIREFHARPYRPIREYGGWGLRYGPSGKAYNVKGDRGVQLLLEGREKLLVGSQRPEEFEGALARATGRQPLPASASS